MSKLSTNYDYQCFIDQRVGGISRYFCELIENLPQNDADSHIWAGFHRNAYLNHLIGRANVHGLGPIMIPKTTQIIKKINKLAWSAYYIRKIKRNSICHATYYDWLPLMPGVKRVMTVHDFIHERFYIKKNPCAARQFIEKKNKALRSADLIISVSDATRADLEFYLPDLAHKCFTVHHGVKPRSNKSWRPDTKSPYLLFIGKRDEYKNFSLLHSAFLNSAHLRSNFRVICLGGGPFSESELVAGARFEMIDGNDDVLDDLLMRASALIYPSLLEGFGLPVLEAMSVGCPVICVPVTSLPEVAGNHAIWINGSDPDSLVSAILKLHTHQSNLVIERKKHAERFTWQLCGQRTMDLYKTI